MLDKVDDSFDKRQGSIMYDVMVPFAYEVMYQNKYLRSLIFQAFVSKAEGQFLDFAAQDYGIKRNPATFAEVPIQYIGEPGTLVPRDSQVGDFSRPEVYFITSENLTLDSSGHGVVRAVANVGGTIGNVIAGYVVNDLSGITGVTSVTNLEQAKGGAEEEPDEILRNRILFQKRNPEHGGTLIDYEKWALTVEGVEYARAINVPRGLGTVDLIIGANLSIIDRVVKEVFNVVDKKKPSGIDVIVRKVSSFKQTFKVKVVGLDSQTAQDVVLQYIKSLPVGGDVLLSRISASLIVAGAEDATVLEPTTNVIIPDDSIIEPTVVIV